MRLIKITAVSTLILLSVLTQKSFADNNHGLLHKANLLVQLTDTENMPISERTKQKIREIIGGQSQAPTVSHISSFVCQKVQKLAGANQVCVLTIVDRDKSASATESSTTIKFSADINGSKAFVTEIQEVSSAG